MRELFTKNNRLVDEVEWKIMISEIKKKTNNGEINDKKTAITILSKSIEDAIKKRIPDEKFGVLFSGGVDSTLIVFLCRKLNADFTCYSVGLKNSDDIRWAGSVAEKYDFEWKHREYSVEEVEEYVRKAIRATGFIEDENMAVTAGVASVEIAAIELAKKDGIKILFGGLGSEEIFAGYERHIKAENINEECWAGLLRMWRRDLLRDSKVASNYNVEFRTPFLDEELIEAAMQVPGEFKINSEHKKLVLREVAEQLGLESEFAFRPKKAAQYGSGFDKAIEKLAKMKGFRKKGEWLKGLVLI